MSNVIIWKLQDKDASYDQWYDFLTWMEHKGVEEVSTWNDTVYTGSIYKAYRVFDDHDLTYILLKWNVLNKGDYHKWIEKKHKIDSTVYTKKDIRIIVDDIIEEDNEKGVC